MMHLEVRLCRKKKVKGGKCKTIFMQMTVFFQPLVWWFFNKWSKVVCVKRCKKKKQYSFSSPLLGRCLLAVDFTSATSPLCLYIHFGSSLGPPPHSSAPVRGFPAACKLHAHIWTEDVTESPPSRLSSSPFWRDGDWRCNKWRPALPGKTLEYWHFMTHLAFNIGNVGT